MAGRTELGLPALPGQDQVLQGRTGGLRGGGAAS